MTHSPAPSSAKSYTHQWVAFALMVLVLALAPLWVYPVFLMKVMCFALFACAFNLLIGYGGLLSFGHALYFGWASYMSAHAAKDWGLSPEVAILTGTATAAACGIVAGSLAIRRQGIYFAMITLALAQMTALPVLAQDADEGGLEEIIVTAQRREQSLQDVPVSVTAFTGEATLSGTCTAPGKTGAVAMVEISGYGSRRGGTLLVQLAPPA